jgi:hypothetical protein
MDKLPFSELEKRLNDARAFIAPGSRWQHYKGGKYVVTDLVIIERTNEVAVMYRSLEHPTVPFLRPLVEWQDVVAYEGNKLYRFRQLGA